MENVSWIITGGAGLAGVVVGALLVLAAIKSQRKWQERQENKKEEMKRVTEEIDVLLLLNKKINEILMKRNLLLPKYVSFDAFDDCFITIDDYVYLQSFAAQNHFLLPNYLVEEFFKNIAVRQVVLSPEETTDIGGYTYKGGRLLVEQFSDNLISIIEDRKIQLKKMKNNDVK
nr:hypothetical protein [Enterococcus timonensis]